LYIYHILVFVIVKHNGDEPAKNYAFALFSKCTTIRTVQVFTYSA